MRINVSAILEWKFCPRSYWNKFVERRARPAGEALADGSYWHAVAEAALRPLVRAEGGYGVGWGAGRAETRSLPATNAIATETADLPISRAAPSAEWGAGMGGDRPLADPPAGLGAVNDLQQRMREGARELPAALAGWEVLALEAPLAARLGEHELVGTPDGVVRNRETGRLYSLQWKTVAGSRPLDVLFDEVRVSWHEAAYQWMLQQRCGEPLAGTLLGAWRKLSARQIANGEEPLVIVPLARGQSEVEQAMHEIKVLIHEIAEEEEGETVSRARNPGGPSYLIPNRRSCVSWNWRCQYFGVCWGGRKLADEEFVTVEDRYTDLEAAT